MPIDSFQGIHLAKGLIYNYKPFFQFGSASAVGTSEVTVWNASSLYVYPPGPMQMKVSSSSVNDNPAGTGAGQITINGLDHNYDEVEEVVILDGRNPVLTNTFFVRVFNARVTCGTDAAGDVYVGDGTVTAGVPQIKYAKVVVGDNDTMMALWTVPRGYTAYMQQGTISSGTESANRYITAKLKIRPFGQCFQTKAKVTGSNTFMPFDFGVALPITEKSDIEARAVASGGTQQVSVTFSIIYGKND